MTGKHMLPLHMDVWCTLVVIVMLRVVAGSQGTM
jgi:hypothetical protein